MAVTDKPQIPPSPQATEKPVTAQEAAVAGRAQQGEKASSLTTRPPRGVEEPPADQIAEDEGVAAAQKSVIETVQAATERGYRGEQADPTPNENYTVKGVTTGKPTPETVIVTPQGA